MVFRIILQSFMVKFLGVDLKWWLLFYAIFYMAAPDPLPFPYTESVLKINFFVGILEWKLYFRKQDGIKDYIA